MIRTASYCLFVVLAAWSMHVGRAADDSKLAAKDKPKIIKPQEARRYVDREVTVEFTVENSRELLDKKIGFLNSEKDLKSPTNFTAFLSGKGLQKLKEEAKIKEPAVYFLKKKVRVTGKVVLYHEKVEIVVDSPKQIKIVVEQEN